MGAEVGAATANCALCPAPLCSRRCVPWDQATPPMAEVSTFFFPHLAKGNSQISRFVILRPDDRLKTAQERRDWFYSSS